jgi:hypothetical protein
MASNDPAQFRLPDLRFVEVDRLVPHEKEDEGRTTSLATRLRENGVLRNPPIVTPAVTGTIPAGADDRFVVLDGANRVSTVRAAGFPHLVVQVVRYDDPGVRLSTWHHALGSTASEDFAAGTRVHPRPRAPGGRVEPRAGPSLQGANRSRLWQRRTVAWSRSTEGTISTRGTAS